MPWPPTFTLGEDGHPYEHNRLRFQVESFGRNVREFGAVGDGIADDTAALQAAIDVLGAAVGTPVHALVLPPGVFRITDTLRAYHRGLNLLGQGVGNPSDLSGSPGRGTTIRWDGVAGAPMVEVEDARYVRLADLHLNGKDSAPPVGIRYLAGGTVGTNELLRLERVRIGAWGWTPAGGDGGAMLDGIVLDGPNQNNDQFAFRDVEIDQCSGDGIRIANSQSVWGLLDSVFLSRCGVGLRTAATLTGVNLTCNRCGVDVQVEGSAQINLTGWYSENGGIPGVVTSAGGRLNVNGGYLLITADSPMSPYLIDVQDAGNGGGLTLTNVRANDQTASPARTVRVVGADSTNPGSVVATGCYLPEFGWDVTAGTGGLDVDVTDLTGRRSGRLTDGQTLTALS